MTEKLSKYEVNLKERRKQLKEMVAELKNYQAQVHAYQFEIQRLDNENKKLKSAYFDIRSHQMNAIPEAEEDAYDQQQQQMMGQQAYQGYG